MNNAFEPLLQELSTRAELDDQRRIRLESQAWGRPGPLRPKSVIPEPNLDRQASDLRKKLEGLEAQSGTTRRVQTSGS